jgi:hypothetical protein
MSTQATLAALSGKVAPGNGEDTQRGPAKEAAEEGVSAQTLW